jgi:type VI secretion system secreted protein Hcp
MAVDMFLKIEGVDGESKDKQGHTGEIDVLSFSWGETNTADSAIGGGGGRGKVDVHDMQITKIVDKSSPVLFVSCANGKHFKQAKLTVRKAGEKPLEFKTIVMTDVLISSWHVGGAQGGDMTEQISLNFASVEVTYVEQDEKGGKKGEAKQKWDVKGNIAK